MATVILVNNTNFISGTTVAWNSDPALAPLTQGSVANLGTVRGYGSPMVDISSSFETGYIVPSSSIYVPWISGSLADISSSFSLLGFSLGSGFFFQNSVGASFILAGDFSSISNANATTYIIRGFYLGSGQYEYWESPTRTSSPPSGHSLIEVTVVGEIKGGSG
jgi:hypothetical protein